MKRARKWIRLRYRHATHVCLFFGFCLLGLTSGNVRAAVESANKNETLQNQFKVTAVTSQFSPISEHLTYPGLIEARVHAFLLAEVDGAVKKIHGVLGQKIKAGNSLITLQQMDPIFQFAPVIMRSPVNGMISELLVTEGTLVSKGQKLASVTDPRDLRVAIEIPAQDLSLLQVGMLGQWMTPSISEKIVISVRLMGVSPHVDSATGTATAQLVFLKPKTVRLTPGMMGQVQFEAHQHRGILIPEVAVLGVKQEKYVRIVEEGKIKKKGIEVGLRKGDMIEIKSGLQEGQTVVIRANHYVTEGDTVIVEKQEQDPVQNQDNKKSSTGS